MFAPPFFLAALATVASLSAAFTADLTVSQCTSSSGCKPVQKRVALDATSNGTEKLVQVNGNSMTLSYGGPVLGGPRVYLIEEDGTNKNTLFMLKAQEFTFDVELSSMPCGFNAALYFVGMDANTGGAENGTNYCDAQAVGGTFCSEMDIMEANTVAQQYTTHACVDACGSHTDGVPQCKGNGSPAAVCDQSGCGLNPFRYGPGTTYNNEYPNDKWYGVGSGFTLDSSQTFTVVTQFHTDDGTSTGTLMNISRFYLQKGGRVDLPILYVMKPTDGQHMGGYVHPTLTPDFCTDIYDRWNGNMGDVPLSQMGKNMDAGMVLAMSAWYSKETYPLESSQTGMSWLDGSNNWGKIVRAGPCDATTTDTAGPYHATFSDIRMGDIGSTTGGAPPSPTPPGPAPPPTPPTPPTPPSPPSPGNNVCADTRPQCTVCTACCHSYIPAGAPCDKCVSENCK